MLWLEYILQVNKLNILKWIEIETEISIYYLCRKFREITCHFISFRAYLVTILTPIFKRLTKELYVPFSLRYAFQ
jgi:hypothetical protein